MKIPILGAGDVVRRGVLWLIRDRGWTEAGVREFGGAPDKVTVKTSGCNR